VDLYLLLESRGNSYVEAPLVANCASWIPAPPASTNTEGADSHHRHRIVVKDGGYVFGGELVGGVADKQACLAHGTISHDHTPGRTQRQPSYLSGSNGIALPAMHLGVTSALSAEWQTRGSESGTDLIVATTILTSRHWREVQPTREADGERESERGVKVVVGGIAAVEEEGDEEGDV
jgi:hypothetical protein